MQTITEAKQKLDDKLKLVDMGLTEEKAEKIVTAPPVQITVPYKHSQSRMVFLMSAILVVLIIVAIIFIVVLYKREADMRRQEKWRICDKWYDRYSGAQYVVTGYDSVAQTAKGSGPSGHFIIGFTEGDSVYTTSNILPRSGKLFGNQLLWNNTIWDREAIL